MSTYDDDYRKYNLTPNPRRKGYKNDPNETVNIVGIERDLAELLQSQLSAFLKNQFDEKKKFKLTHKSSIWL